MGLSPPCTLEHLLDTTLPLNRKERQYTGTVLPALLSGEGLSHLSTFTGLLGYPGVQVAATADDCSVLFFTEYGISESAIGPAAERFEGMPTGRDTPDVVILCTRPEPVLFAIEAKMYDRPGGHELQNQLDAQAVLLRPLAE